LFLTKLAFTKQSCHSPNFSMKSVAVITAALLACTQGQFQQFFSTTSPSSYLPAMNLAAGAGNPYKGINTSPWFYAFGPKENIPYSIDFYYIPLNKIMIGNPATLGDAAFNKTYLENILQGSRDRAKHVIPRVYLEYPGQATGVPQFLIDGGLQFSYSGDKVSKSPDYNDTNLHNALQSYIAWFGKNYDGDYRIAFIELRLLGFWGEWHNFPYQFIPDSLRLSVESWYKAAFSHSVLVARYVDAAGVVAGGFGLHDDFFTASNNPLQQYNYTDFWKRTVSGGEVHPENSWIFNGSYVPGSPTSNMQDWYTAANFMHTSYMGLSPIFNDNVDQGTIARAAAGSNYLGYAFYVSAFSASSDGNTVNLDITITQAGIAPFYFFLYLRVMCDSLTAPIDTFGVHYIIEAGSSKTFTVTGLSPSPTCMDTLQLSLHCPIAYTANPVKFAQGQNGTVLALSIPEPPPPKAKLSKGAIIGIAVGGVCAVGIAGLVGFKAYKAKRGRQAFLDNEMYNSNPHI
jgi:hypothetical protein